MAEIPKSGLAAQLQKFYTRKGNRIVFSNGMTLNQLAWEMWERLGYKEIDPSVLSRVLRGERLFGIKQLKVFFSILGLGKKEKNDLKEMLYEELFTRFGFDESFYKLKDSYYLELIEDNLTKIREVKFKDLPTLAESWSFSLLHKLEGDIEKRFNNKVRFKILTLKGYILNEILDIQLAAEPLESMETAVTESANRLSELGIILKNGKFLGLGQALKGNMLNVINKDNNKAVILLENGIKSGLTRFGTIAAYRALALSYANLHKDNLFDEVRSKLVRLAEGFPEQKDYVLEGLARGEAVLGRSDDARKSMSQSWENHFRNKDYLWNELREIENMRTDVQITVYSKKRKDGPSENDINQVLSKARKLGYFRMEQEILNFVNRSPELFLG